jgi:hypothetical protein
MNTIGYLSNPDNYPNSHSPKVMSIQVHHWTSYQSKPTQLPAILPDWVAETWDDFTGNRLHFTDIRDSNSIATPLTGDVISELKKLKGRQLNSVELRDAESNGVLSYAVECSAVSRLSVGRLGSVPQNSVEVIGKLDGLAVLEIRDDRLSDKDIASLSRKPDLQMFSFNGKNLGPLGVDSIGKSTRLVSITIQSGSLNSDQLCSILAVPSLEHIRLDHCCINNTQSFPSRINSRLKFLQMSGVSVSSNTLLAVPVSAPLEFLSMDSGTLDAATARALAGLRHAKKIVIINSQVHDEFLVELESTNGLTLEFHRCDISPSAVERLRKNASVTEKEESIRVDF